MMDDSQSQGIYGSIRFAKNNSLLPAIKMFRTPNILFTHFWS